MDSTVRVQEVRYADKINKMSQQRTQLDCFLPAEREGFEPPEPLSSTVFKTAAIDHSAISPSNIIKKRYKGKESFYMYKIIWDFQQFRLGARTSRPHYACGTSAHQIIFSRYPM